MTEVEAGSFEGFYRSSWDEVYRAVWVTIRDADLAAEATDEAMARAFQRWDQVRGYTNVWGWVYRVAVNWAITRLRRCTRDRRWSYWFVMALLLVLATPSLVARPRSGSREPASVG